MGRFLGFGLYIGAAYLVQSFAFSNKNPGIVIALAAFSIILFVLAFKHFLNYTPDPTPAPTPEKKSPQEVDVYSSMRGSGRGPFDS